ncbi:MAG: peptidoglycan-binding protein [Gammaproteobacteria bacterium]|nr:peptidoglycan-binding protein [Gammaproteobacteria bacterium]
MSTVINSINYLFKPDKGTQSLCEGIVKTIKGNGASLSDITVLSATIKEVSVNTQFVWNVKVSLKASIMSGKDRVNAVLHNSVSEAQAAAKKQGQHIIQNSLGKIELIHNINEDPAHFFKHSTVKLNGGKPHAYVELCDRHCDRGQVKCPRCAGKGTHKAITKKQDLLRTTENFSAINTCPDCSGRGTIDCKNCSGSGEVKRVYTVHVDASRKHKNSVDTADPGVKKEIESFLSRQSHQTLIDDYLTPALLKLKDVDKDHCAVLYQSKTKYLLLSLLVLNKEYKILGFGDNVKCIAKPKILDDILLAAVNSVVGISAKIKSAGKYSRLQSIPLINIILSSDKNRTTDDLETLLENNSDELLSKDSIHSIIKKLTQLKEALIPRYSLFSWIGITSAGLLSGYYFGLAPSSPIGTLTTLVVHIAVFIFLGNLFSRTLTLRKRRKLNFKTDSSSVERIPSLIASVLIIYSTLSPNLLPADQRWSDYYTAEQLIRFFYFVPEKDSETVSSRQLIKATQHKLISLGYKNITADGEYNKETDRAVKDFQKKFRLKESKYLNTNTMATINKYANLKANKFGPKT